MRSAPDDEANEKTLLALADLLVRRGDFRLAAVRLQEFLDRYPGHDKQVTVRQQLADCYRRLAALEDQNLRPGLLLTPEAEIHYKDQRRSWLQKAEANYQKLADDLATKGSSARLTESEETTLRQALWAVADCHFDQGHHIEAIGYFEKLVARYPGQAITLKALQQIIRCYWLQKNREQARATVQRLRDALQAIPDHALSDEPGMPSRQELNRWVEWAWQQ